MSSRPEVPGRGHGLFMMRDVGVVEDMSLLGFTHVQCEILYPQLHPRTQGKSKVEKAYRTVCPVICKISQDSVVILNKRAGKG